MDHAPENVLIHTARYAPECGQPRLNHLAESEIRLQTSDYHHLAADA